MPLGWGDADILNFLGDQLVLQRTGGGGVVVVVLLREDRELS